MPRKVKEPGTQRKTGPVDLEGGTRFPLGRGQSLEYVQSVHRLVFGSDSFLIVLYGARNVGGLIGTEYNGIAVLWENRGKVVLMEHCPDSPRMGTVSDRQHVEYERICSMDEAQFRTFVNLSPAAQHKVLVAKPRQILRPKLGFMSAGFVATQFATIEDKVLFIEALIRFLCHHCDRDHFTRRIYDGLSQHLGHIAHYNLDVFYDTWFGNLPDRIRFLKYHSNEQVFGDWRDVAEAFKKWIASPEGQAVLAHYENGLARQIEEIELDQFARLKAKYETPAKKEA
jgi:hypothetical protein